jgi:hypothetical protein
MEDHKIIRIKKLKNSKINSKMKLKSKLEINKLKKQGCAAVQEKNNNLQMKRVKEIKN